MNRLPWLPIAPPTAEAQLRALASPPKSTATSGRRDAHASPYINHPIELARVLSVSGHHRRDHAVLLRSAPTRSKTTKTRTTSCWRASGKRGPAWWPRSTDDKALSKAERKRLQVVHAPHISQRAALVKLATILATCADVADNPPVGWPRERRREYFDWAKQWSMRCAGAHAAACDLRLGACQRP